MNGAADAHNARSGQHPYSFGRCFRLGRNKQFQYVFRRGKRTPGRLLMLTHLKGRDQKAGFSVSAKVGKAVLRNRIRRMLKEDFRMLRPSLKPGKYIFVARSGAAQASHQALGAEMKYLLHKADLFRQEDRP